MRIGIDARLWDQTGVGRYTRNLIKNLSLVDKKNEYFLFVRPEDSEKIRQTLRNDRFHYIPVNFKWHSILEQTEFPNFLKKQNLDLMHFPYFSVPVFYNRPFVVTIHDLIINHFSTGRASTLLYPLYLGKLFSYKFVIGKAAKNAVKIISPSQATKDEVVDHLKVKPEKIVVTYEGPDEDISLQKEKDLKLGKYFLYVGNAYPHKNLERLILAFNELNKEQKDIKLILVGGKDYFYKRLTKESDNPNVVFYGKAKDEELSSLYSNATALVMPSLMEGFGLPVLEAMSLKCPLIISDIPSLREIAGKNAIYFNPKSLEDIKTALEKGLKGEGKEKVEKAYEKSKEFSWQKMAEETLKVYESSVSLR